jgi:hypothetical protein
MTAMPCTAFATYAELAAAAHTPPADARRLVIGVNTVAPSSAHSGAAAR